MVKVLELAVAALAGIAQSRNEEAVVVQSVDHGGRGIGNVLALLILDIVGVLAAGDAKILCLCAAIWAEEGLPVLGDAEDDVGAGKRGLEALDVVELSLDHLCAQGGEGL